MMPLHSPESMLQTCRRGWEPPQVVTTSGSDAKDTLVTAVLCFGSVAWQAPKPVTGTVILSEREERRRQRRPRTIVPDGYAAVGVPGEVKCAGRVHRADRDFAAAPPLKSRLQRTPNDCGRPAAATPKEL